jgi:hypothetical protein
MCAITPPKNIAIIAIVGVAIASSLCERVLVFGGHYATPGITRTDNVVPGRPSHPAVRATLNTTTAAQLEAIEPRTIAIIMRFLKVEFCRP